MANNLPRLLIVDDIAGNRKTLIASLWQEKVETFEAETGVEALAMLDEVDPDLILLDVMMPELDGFETTRRIRQRDGYQGLPIVLVTALDDNVSLLEGLEAGADDFISKPFNQLELRARVGSILRLNSYRRLEEERAARNAADAQARHTQQVYRAVVEKAQLMVHMTSAQGDILFTNGPWQKQLGYSEEEAANLNLAEIVLEEDLEHCFSIHSRIFATDENAFIEARL
ncbi:MAG: response regulator, partial [Longimicrobiales bacterium]|nr:response regulator [Longimicrobiales bacterium]